jgi:hypothetical protein
MHAGSSRHAGDDFVWMGCGQGMYMVMHVCALYHNIACDWQDCNAQFGSA